MSFVTVWGILLCIHFPSCKSGRVGCRMYVYGCLSSMLTLWIYITDAGIGVLTYFWAGHVEMCFETVNLNNTHVWLGDRMRAAELKYPRVVIGQLVSIFSDASWITSQETCAVQNCSGMWAAVWQGAWHPGNWSLLATNCIQKLASSQRWKEKTHFTNLNPQKPVVYQQTTLGNIMPCILVTATQLCSFGWDNVLFVMSLPRRRHVLSELGRCKWPRFIFAPSSCCSPQ